MTPNVIIRVLERGMEKDSKLEEERMWRKKQE